MPLDLRFAAFGAQRMLKDTKKSDMRPQTASSQRNFATPENGLRGREGGGGEWSCPSNFLEIWRNRGNQKIGLQRLAASTGFRSSPFSPNFKKTRHSVMILKTAKNKMGHPLRELATKNHEVCLSTQKWTLAGRFF